MKQYYSISLALCIASYGFACDTNDPKDLIQQGRFDEALPILEDQFRNTTNVDEEKVIGILLAQTCCAVALETNDKWLFDRGIRLFTLYDSKYQDNSKAAHNGKKIMTATEGLGDIFGMVGALQKKNERRIQRGKLPYDLYLEAFRYKTAAIAARMGSMGQVINDPATLVLYKKIVPLISAVQSDYIFAPKQPYIIPDQDTLERCKETLQAIYAKGKIPVTLTWRSGSPDDNDIEKPVLAAGTVGLLRQRSVHVALFTKIAQQCLDKICFVVTNGPPDHIMTKDEFDTLPENKKRRNLKNLLIPDDEFDTLSEADKVYFRQCRTPIKKGHLQDMFMPIGGDDPGKPFEKTIAMHGLCPLALTTDTLNLWIIESIKTNLPIDEKRTGICCIPKNAADSSSNVDWRHMTHTPLHEGPQSRWHDRIRTFEIDPTDDSHIHKVAESFARMVAVHQAS